MIGGSQNERDLKMNAERASPASESDGTVCSEGVDYLQKYFGQSSYNRILSSTDRLTVGVSTGKQDEPMKSTGRVEFDAELSSIFFGRDEKRNRNQSSVEETDTGGLLRNQSLEDDDSTGHARLFTLPTPEWANTQLQAGWNWAKESYYPTEKKEWDDEPEGTQKSRARPTEGKDGRDWNHQNEGMKDNLDEDKTSLVLSDEVHERETEETTHEHQHLPSAGHPNPSASSNSGSSITIHHSSQPANKTSSRLSHMPPLAIESELNLAVSSSDTNAINNNNNNCIENELLSHSIASSHQFIQPPLVLDSSLSLDHIDLPHKSTDYYPHHHLESSSYPFNSYHQMTLSSLPSHKSSHSVPLDLSHFWSSLSSSASQLNPIDQLLTGSVTEDDHNQHQIDLEFNHLVVEEQCAPSTPSSSSPFSNQHPTRPSTSHSHRLLKNSLKSTADFTQSFLSIDPLSSFFPAVDQGPPLYPSHQSASGLNHPHDLNNTFRNFINTSLDLCPPSPAPSAPHQSVSSSTLPPLFSNPFLSDHPVSTQATSTIDSPLVSQLHPSPLLEHPPHHLFQTSVPSTSLPSPSTLSHPAVLTPQSTPRNRLPNHSGVVRPIESRNTLDHRKDNPFVHRPQSHSSLNKSNIATAEVPTEIELAIPRLDRLNLSKPYPNDLNLFLVGLQAQGAKTRVETQIKLTLVLVTGQGGSIDRNGNLSTETQHTLTRIGNWSHIKLPVYSAIKRKSKKLIKTGIPPEETLFLDVAVVRASEPEEEIYCCSNCQVREQKRTQRKRDARVRPAQEIESDEAEQSIRPEDEKRKIVVFNCGQYVNFESGEVTLPTRITCYCRHHREKKGFRVKVTLRDHTHRLIATSTTPAIMITDDHKAVAAAAKAKSGSDAEDNQPRGRLIRRLPNTGSQKTASVPTRSKKKLLSASIESTSEQKVSGSTDDKDIYDSATSWTSSHQNGARRLHSRSQSSSRSISTKCKRKAVNELNLRANMSRRTASLQTAANAQIGEISNSLSTADNTVVDANNQRTQSLGYHCPVQESKPHSTASTHVMTIPMPSLTTHMRSTTPASTYLWHGCPSFSKQFWREEIPLSRHIEIDSALTLDIEMKDLINPVQEFDKRNVDTDRICSPAPPPLNRSNAEKSLNYSSSFAPSKIAAVTEIGVGSQPRELSRLSGQGCPTSQQCYSARRPNLSCSTTTPDQTVLFPCSARVSASPISGSSVASPKSSVDSRFNQFKCSNPTSRSSSIVCTQRGEGSDTSSHTGESTRGLHILPSQSDSPLEQLPGDQPEPHSNSLDESSPTCSPVNDTSMTILGNFLANWNVVSSLLPSSQAMNACTSPNSLPNEISTTSRETANIHPMLNGKNSSGSQKDTDQSQTNISKLIPNEGPVHGGIEITILGNNFHPGLKVDFGSGGVVETEFWSTNTLICILPSSAHSGPCEVSLVDEGDLEGQQNKTAQIFTYVDQTDQRLMELALQVVGLKMTGQVQDPKSLARKIIIETKQFEGSPHEFSNHTANLVTKAGYEQQKNNFMDVNFLEILEDDGKEQDVTQDDGINWPLLRTDLYSYIRAKTKDSNRVKLNLFIFIFLLYPKLIDMFWMLSILVTGGACGLLIMMRTILKNKLLKQGLIGRFEFFEMDFIPNLLEL